MKDKESLHKKVQEHIDCFATTDPLKEMSEIKGAQDEDEAVLKWLALAALHGINMNAKKITVIKSKYGLVEALAEYREAKLPSPGKNIGEKVIQALKSITHMEEGSGETTLALGIRDGSIDLQVRLEKDEEGEKVTLVFP